MFFVVSQHVLFFSLFFSLIVYDDQCVPAAEATLELEVVLSMLRAVLFRAVRLARTADKFVHFDLPARKERRNTGKNTIY